MHFAIYTRKSYYSDTSDSVTMQRTACEEYIRKTFDAPDSVTVYQDDGFVRSDMDRPGMNRLRDDIADGLVGCVVIYRIDRICSDLSDFCRFYSFLKENDIKFVTVKDGIDTTTPIGEAMMYLAVVFSGLEIGTASIRIRDNMRTIASMGYWPGGRAPFGYRLEPVTAENGKRHKILVPAPDEIGIRDQMVAMLLDDDLTLQGMETRLRKEGFRAQGGGMMTTTQLHQILRSPFCAPACAAVYDHFAALGCIMDDAAPRDAWDGSRGVMVYGRTMEKKINGKKRHTPAPPSDWRVSIGRHEPTMSADVWLAVQARFGAHQIVRTPKYEPALLRGVLRCSCGRLFSMARRKRLDGISTWYACPRRSRNPEACRVSQIKADLIDDRVLDIFREISHDPATVKKYLPKPAKKPKKSKTADLEKKIARLTAALADAEGRRASRHVLAEIDRLDEQLTAARRADLDARRADRDVDGALKKRDEIVRLLADFDSFTAAEKNEIARSVVRSATWDGDTLFLTL